MHLTWSFRRLDAQSCLGLMVWVGILWGECRNIIRMTPFKDVVFYSFEEVGYELGNPDELGGADVCTIVSMFDQVDIHSGK